MSNRHLIQDHFAQVPLFSGLGSKDKRAVRDLFSEIDVVAGHVLARQQSRASEFLIIVSGTASVDRNGLHVADLGPGDFHGEISLLDGGRRTATVTATSPTHIMVATQREFVAMLASFPTIARQVLPVLASRVPVSWTSRTAMPASTRERALVARSRHLKS